jgi:dihydropteroate synthase
MAPVAPTAWRTARGRHALDRPWVVGILNVTPDSFWDGGRHAALDAAVARAAALLEEGADILDIGGESTRPGATPVPAAAETGRVVPVVEAVLRRFPDAILSIDTVKADVARAALDAGAAIINDVSGLRLDPRLGVAVAAAGAGLVLMHSRGGVADMASYALAGYGPDPVESVVEELREAIARAADAGVDRDAIVIDPGLGFSKRTEESLAVLGGIGRIAALGLPVLVGPSRKRFIGEAAGGLTADERLEGTIAACVVALLGGARLFRVHDAGAVRRALAVADAAVKAGAASAELVTAGTAERAGRVEP